MATTADIPRSAPIAGQPPAADPPRAGPILAAWMALAVLLQGVTWASGARETAVGEAVEAGAARVETEGVGEVADQVVRKAIGLQRDTRGFWVAMLALGDFGFEPLGLALRAVAVATLFAGVALVRGRPVEFAAGLASCASAQGFWVLGLAVRACLAIVLRRPEIETSATLLLPPGSPHAFEWVTLRQLDAFALMGWLAMAWGGRKRGQVKWLGAVMICGGLFVAEALMRMPWALLIESGMRLTLIPDV